MQDCIEEMELVKTSWGYHIDSIIDDMGKEHDAEFLSHLKEAQAVVQRLLETDEKLFEVWKHKDGVSRTTCFSLTGKKLKSLIRRGCDLRCKEAPFVNSHPYVQAYHAAVEKLGLDSLDDWDLIDQADKLNAAVDMIREGCRGHVMRQYMRKLENAKKVRRKSAQKLVNDLRDRYARLEVLRLDLSYREGKYVDLDDFAGALEYVKGDWSRFRHDMVIGVSLPGLVGYLAKLEYGLLSGFHFHVLVFCDGSKHCQDVVLAKILGEHWNNEIVSGEEGRYFNCNRRKNEYRYLGIGTLDYYDHAKYSALVNLVVEYMVKPDYVMAAEAPSQRIWFRSIQKTPRFPRRRGRPRRFISRGG